MKKNLQWHPVVILCVLPTLVSQTTSFAPASTFSFTPPGFLQKQPTLQLRVPHDGCTNNRNIAFRYPGSSRTSSSPTLTSTKTHGLPHNSPLDKAIRKFQANPYAYILVPFAAALIGWITNWIALNLIFCRTGPTADAMVKLMNSPPGGTFRKAFWKLNSGRMADLLAPQIPDLAQQVYQQTGSLAKSTTTTWTAGLPSALFVGIDNVRQGTLRNMNKHFLEYFTENLQENMNHVFSLQNCVRRQMAQRRGELVRLFHQCGKLELTFLANTGLYVGFGLGILQALVALFVESPWALPLGGAAVGLVSNWLALKWLVKPIDPVNVGPFLTLHGAFLTRQKELAAALSSFFADKIVTGETIWKSILTDRSTKPAFASLFNDNVSDFLGRVTTGVGVTMSPETIAQASSNALKALPQHVGSTFAYMDGALGIERTIRSKLERMTSHEFGRFLFPIVEHDKIALILLGGLIGMGGGALLGLVTKDIVLPDLVSRRQMLAELKNARRSVRRGARKLLRAIPDFLDSITPNNWRVTRIFFIRDVQYAWNKLLRTLRFRSRGVKEAVDWEARRRYLVSKQKSTKK